MTLSRAEPRRGAPELRLEPRARGLALLLLAGGLVGLGAAGTLLVEKFRLLADPSYEPSCSINPVLSCGSVMQTAQAEVFGFPNPVLGVIGFSVVSTVGAALLAGASFAPWFWRGMQVGVLLGTIFVHWLIFQSLYRIGALCPYCMAVWAVTIPVFLHTTLHVARIGVLGHGARSWAVAIHPVRGALLTGWYLAVLTLVAVEFWTYWRTLVR